MIPVTSIPAALEAPVTPASAVAVPAAPSNTDGVSWSEAKNYIGKTVKICGIVTSTHWASASKGKPSFLNMGKPYPDPARFTIIIWGSNRDKFAQPPETLYEGKTICVTGFITLYNGMTEVEVKSPAQISLR